MSPISRIDGFDRFVHALPSSQGAVLAEFLHSPFSQTSSVQELLSFQLILDEDDPSRDSDNLPNRSIRLTNPMYYSGTERYFM